MVYRCLDDDPEKGVPFADMDITLKVIDKDDDESDLVDLQLRVNNTARRVNGISHPSLETASMAPSLPP